MKSGSGCYGCERGCHCRLLRTGQLIVETGRTASRLEEWRRERVGHWWRVRRDGGDEGGAKECCPRRGGERATWRVEEC
jgi:hypothetical protein